MHLDQVLPKIFLLCHLGQRWLNAEKKTFDAKLDQDAQYKTKQIDIKPKNWTRPITNEPTNQSKSQFLHTKLAFAIFLAIYAAGVIEPFANAGEQRNFLQIYQFVWA